MRRYKIVLTGASSSSTVAGAVTVSAAATTTYDSQIGGQDNPSALDIAFDITVAQLDIALAGSYVEVFGVSLQDVTKVRQWQGGSLSLYGGFSSGFPLAKANQYGLLARGTIQQAYGNWTGLSQSIIFILTSGGTDNACVFHWKKGQKLSEAITAAVTYGYPGFTVKSNLSNDFVRTSPDDDLHFCDSIYQLASYVRESTNAAGLATGIGGVNMVLGGSIVNLYDTAGTAAPIQLEFNDLQGQPVYFGVGSSTTVETTLNLRYDLALLNRFSFPTQVATGYVLNQPASSTAPLAKDNSALSGTYMVRNLRHVGRFRDPSGLGWVTIADGVPA